MVHAGIYNDNEREGNKMKKLKAQYIAIAQELLCEHDPDGRRELRIELDAIGAKLLMAGIDPDSL